MAENYLIEPDPGFIKEVVGLGGESLKKCYQCATCSVACPISPDNKPFPRKEMIAASWGLKDRLVGNHDIWLCHNCGDCSTLCPRDAKPGDVLAAIRQYAITDYAAPKALGKMVNDPSKLPVLLGIPTVLFIVVGLLTGLLDFSPGGDEVVQWHFFSTWLVDMFFVPLALWVIVSFALALKRFLGDIHASALETGKTDKAKIEPVGFVLALIRVIPTILTHRKFTECSENNSRSTPHLMVLFSFIALLIVTTYAFITLYGLGIHSPHSQLNPIKWLANAGGIALIVGSLLLIKERRAKTDEVSH